MSSSYDASFLVFMSTDNNFSDLPLDLIRTIGSISDGESVASAICTCSCLRFLADYQPLWKSLCNTMWPSTSAIDDHIITSIGGYQKLYAMCRPYVLCNYPPLPINEMYHFSRSDFSICVDMEYNNVHVFSAYLEKIPGGEYFDRWFDSSSFRLDVLSILGCREEIELSIKGKSSTYLKSLMQNVRLSYILVDKRNGRAVNLSSRMAISGSIQGKRDFVLRFCSAIPGDGSVGEVVECHIEVGFCLSEAGKEDDESRVKLADLSLVMKDAAGDTLNGRIGLILMERTTRCKRSIFRERFMESYAVYANARIGFEEKKMVRKATVSVIFLFLLWFFLQSVCESSRT